MGRGQLLWASSVLLPRWAPGGLALEWMVIPPSHWNQKGWGDPVRAVHPQKLPTVPSSSSFSSWPPPPCFQDHRVWVPQCSLQAGGGFGHQHLHVVCGHHKSRAHFTGISGPGRGQLSGPEAAGDQGAGAAMRVSPPALLPPLLPGGDLAL